MSGRLQLVSLTKARPNLSNFTQEFIYAQTFVGEGPIEWLMDNNSRLLLHLYTIFQRYNEPNGPSPRES
jgi:hypothetical protein